MLKLSCFSSKSSILKRSLSTLSLSSSLPSSALTSNRKASLSCTVYPLQTCSLSITSRIKSSTLSSSLFNTKDHRKLCCRKFSTSQPVSSSSTPSPSLSSSSSTSGESPYDVSKRDKAVSVWLFSVCAFVFAIIIVGGQTRRTRSGLSMVEWRPADIFPPLTDEDWEKEFQLYKEFPEYQQVNSSMSLQEFKKIFWLEFIHRQLARVTGIVFLVPFVYFVARKRLPTSLVKRLSVVFGIGGVQAGIGWWMVKSGLDKPYESHTGHYHVSPYRLATHLMGGILISVLLLSTSLHVAFPHAARTITLFNQTPQLQTLRKQMMTVCSMILLTMLSGAFVASNDAGLIYKEFPLMGGKLIPSDIINDSIIPKWKNLFENGTTVQFEHRILAVTTFVATVLVFYKTRSLHGTARRAGSALLHASMLQVALGILTLLNDHPVGFQHLAGAHQANSILVLWLAVVLMHALGKKKPTLHTIKMVQAYSTPSGHLLK